MFGRGVGQQFGGQRAQAAAGAVADDGVADLAAGGQAIMDVWGGRMRRADLQDESGRDPFFTAGGYSKKFSAFA